MRARAAKIQGFCPHLKIVGGGHELFHLLAGEDVSGSEVALSVTVLASLGGGDLDDLLTWKGRQQHLVRNRGIKTCWSVERENPDGAVHRNVRRYDIRIDLQSCRLQRGIVCRRPCKQVATGFRAGFTRSHSHGAGLRRGGAAGFFRTLVGRPLITMKPPLRTLPACMGTVVEAPESAVSNSSTSSWSDIVQRNEGQRVSLGWFRVRCARRKGCREGFHDGFGLLYRILLLVINSYWISLLGSLVIFFLRYLFLFAPVLVDVHAIDEPRGVLPSIARTNSKFATSRVEMFIESQLDIIV